MDHGASSVRVKKFTLPSLLTRPEFWYITLKLCVRLRLHWQCVGAWEVCLHVFTVTNLKTR